MDRTRQTALDVLTQTRLSLVAALDEFEQVASPHAPRRTFFPAETAHALLEQLCARFTAHATASHDLLPPLLLDAVEQEPAELEAMFAAFRETLARPAHQERDEQLRVQAADLIALLRAQLRKEETLLFAMSQSSPRRRPPRGDRP